MKTKRVWNGSYWVEVELCHNAVCNTDVNYGQGIGILQCYDEIPAFSVIVDYGYEKSEQMKLCGQCLANLKKSVRRNGYKLTSQRIG